MVKLTISNISSKVHKHHIFHQSSIHRFIFIFSFPQVGKRVNPATVDSLALKNKQLDEIEVSFVVFKELRQVDLSQNRLRFPRQLENALAAPLLEELDLTGNPIAKELADFRLFIIAHSANTLRHAQWRAGHGR
jgi:Leucine-rich repeat (LRR) protein